MKSRRVPGHAPAVYLEGDTVRSEMRGGFMSDAEYLSVLDNTIIMCADTVIVNRDRRTFYLAQRVAKPMHGSGIWWIGGRRHKGEMPLEGMIRNFLRETGLDLAPERFEFVFHGEYIFSERKQEVRSKGSHTAFHQWVVELSTEELSVVRAGLDSKEYSPTFGLKEFDRKALVEAEVHPVVIEVYDLVFPQGEE